LSQAETQSSLPALTWRKILGLSLTYAFIAFAALSVFSSGATRDARSLLPSEVTAAQAPDILKNLQPAERVALLERERQHLIAEPLDASVLQNLALLHLLQGDVERYKDFVLLGAERSLHDLPVQTAAIALLLEKKDYANALNRLDGVLRSSPTKTMEIFPAILLVSGHEDGLSATTRLLARDPPWRHDFMIFAAKQPDQVTNLYNILTQLRKMNATISDEEIRPYLNNLFIRKSFDAAYFLWLDFLSPDELRKVNHVYDGNFSLQPRNMMFDWNILPAKNSDIAVTVRPGSPADMALKLNFYGSRSAFSNVFQYMRLSPGSFRLKGEARAERLETTGGLMWQMTCAESNAVLGNGPKLNSSGPWANFEFSFSVPVENCATQKLQLVSGSSVVLDQAISGQIYFDTFALDEIE
jgi:hypothetical protein